MEHEISQRAVYSSDVYVVSSHTYPLASTILKAQYIDCHVTVPVRLDAAQRYRVVVFEIADEDESA